ncbi:VOC family protein [Sphaerochaeta globosa]|uniref:Glyoxalase/bleomycin resistance protein/dioxygenase n=1 Tax=Sphaerochaeta globosa (strain ATCC BAA-1886 / DSM 22777 / Buddy) TaxID=158189 RepID=F0RV21_SPHGB|nr:VOC family protein [Sphaerochaeta globosa]ADY12672.1 Glyoxalase/bleomycin resistance protein/dioxygenase [Sphaerochaeta globosa str. Buddy]
MKYSGTLIAVSDMDTSKEFYLHVLGLKVIGDFGANVMLEQGIFLQTLDTWKDFIRKEHVVLSNNAYELYFEENDMDAFLEHLATCDISYIHEPLVHTWGQRVVRFYDVDNHIIEVAEEIGMVVRRFIERGMTEEETAIRMEVPIEYIKKYLKK